MIFHVFPGGPGVAAYVAAKFAIRGLTQCLGTSCFGVSVPSPMLMSLARLTAIELVEHKITVNTYAPGVIMTPAGNSSSALVTRFKSETNLFAEQSLHMQPWTRRMEGLWEHIQNT